MLTKNRAEYECLQIDSSDMLIEADSEWVLGNYPLAAYRFTEAGQKRSEMGQLCFDDSQFSEAAEDWLSATACFLRASNPEMAEIPLDFVRQLKNDNRIPDYRNDLFAALLEREEDLKRLREKIDEFLCAFHERDVQHKSANEGMLAFLLSQVREIPGDAMLHYAIYRHANDLGQTNLAITHLEWANRFEPTKANYVVLLGFEYLDFGEPESAIDIGQIFLENQAADAGQVRIMLANALASAQRSEGPDREEAIRCLLPILESNTAPTPYRFSAMALCALFHAELGHASVATDLLNDLESSANAVGDHTTLDNVAKFRRWLPDVLKQSANGSVSSSVDFKGRDELLAASRILAAA